MTELQERDEEIVQLKKRVLELQEFAAALRVHCLEQTHWLETLYGHKTQPWIGR